MTEARIAAGPVADGSAARTAARVVADVTEARTVPRRIEAGAVVGRSGAGVGVGARAEAEAEAEENGRQAKLPERPWIQTMAKARTIKT